MDYTKLALDSLIETIEKCQIGWTDDADYRIFVPALGHTPRWQLIMDHFEVKRGQVTMIKDAMVANRTVWKNLSRSQTATKKEKKEKLKKEKLDKKRTKISKEGTEEESQRTKEKKEKLDSKKTKISKEEVAGESQRTKEKKEKLDKKTGASKKGKKVLV